MGPMDVDSLTPLNSVNSPNSPPWQISGENNSARSNKRKANDSSNNQPLRAAKMQAVVQHEGTGASVNVLLVPTKNKFAALDGHEDEIIVDKKSSLPRKARLPPITVFDQDRKSLELLLKDITASKYSLKFLRRATHVYCDSADDFKAIRSKLADAKVNHYSHDFQESKPYKVVLHGLHRMDTGDLTTELKTLGLDPTEVRIINPRNPRFTDSVVYVVSFKSGTLKLSDLRTHRAICHTIVQWEPYKRRGGLIQCTRCQRPGHGARNCNMPPRCCVCGSNHETKSCSLTKTNLDGAAAVSSGSTVEVQTPAKCCNCNQDGHFASDPNCPRKLEYVRARQQRASAGRTTRKRHIPQEPGQMRSPVYNGTGASFADVLRGQSGLCENRLSGNLGLSGNSGPSGYSGPSVTSRPSGRLGPSGNLIDEPFSVEEVSALTFEVVSSLRDVSSLPRTEAFVAVMNIAFKYLYRKDAK